MEKPTAPNHDDKSSSADTADDPTPQPLPDFKPSTDGIKDVHMEADPQRKVGTLTAIGKLFTSAGADAIRFADLVRAYANTVWKVAQKKSKPGDWAAPPAVARLQIESIHVDFVAGAEESIRMGEDSSPAIEAAQTVADLMGAKGHDLVELAQELGPDATVAYRGLLKAIGEAGEAEVTWEAPKRSPVTVTSIEASAAHQLLSREGESQSEEFKVLGHLSMADDDLNYFKLKMFKEGPRPLQLKGKRVVQGRFEDAVGNSVREKGLWGENVEALVRMERERAETVAAPRKPSFTLLSVEAISAAPSPRRGGAPIPGSAPLDEEVFRDT